MEKRIYSRQNEGDLCEYSIQWKAYFTSKKEGMEIMAHSLNKVWIHAVWTTKNRVPLIDETVELLIFKKINDEIRGQGCFVKIVNGMPDHVHCLFVLNRSIAIADVIRHAKGASAFYINKNQLLKEKFAWQTGYGAFSVTESSVGIVERYIRYQKQIHSGRMNTSKNTYWTFFGNVIKKKR
jgi:REP element-mobilizing transposase RayT